jgi:serine/threonine protein kinase
MAPALAYTNQLAFLAKRVTTAAATQTASPLAPGYKLDRYELLCPIAEGGMASVWVARQRGKHGFEKLVAIKTILPKFAADPRFQEMFLDEARIACRIEHLNVAQIFDLGEEHDVLYLVMEYVDGDALSKINRACARKGAKIPAGIVLRVLADTCAGLHEAHSLKDGDGRPLEVVHRDVSPHNILVSTKGIAKLIDFGIAKAVSRVGNDTNSGVLKGKIQYMAPEQALGRHVDRRADIWAIGAIAYHLFAGKPAFEGDNHLATLHLLGSGRPPVPLPDSVHPSIRAVVRKALAHSPENRYSTAAELKDAIEDAMIEAMVPTTSADVAAFTLEQVGDRAEKRKAAVDLALSAAAERRRVEELLRPSSDRLSQAGITPSGLVPSAASSAALLPIDRTAPDGPMAKGTPGDAIAKLTPRLSEPPPGSLSYATLGAAGSAAIDASQSMPAAKSRKGLVAVIGIVAVVAAGATIASFTMFRGKPQPAPAAAIPPPPPATTVAPAPPADSTPLPTSSTPSPSSSIPIISATSLPTYAPPTPPPRWTPPPPGPAPAPPPPTPPRKKTVDDGF